MQHDVVCIGLPHYLRGEYLTGKAYWHKSNNFYTFLHEQSKRNKFLVAVSKVIQHNVIFRQSKLQHVHTSTHMDVCTPACE